MFNVFDSLWEKEKKEYKSNRNFYIIIAVVVALMTVILVLNTYVFFVVQVNGSSMYPTLYGGKMVNGYYEGGDSLLANRKKEIEYGSIIIISGEKPYWVIKRLIGMPGDKIEIKDDKVYKNGELLDESGYLEPSVKTEPKYDTTVWELGEDEYFYLGDNRPVSADSRFKENGTCSRSQIVGVVEEWSFSHKTFLSWLGNILDKSKITKD